MSKSLLISQRTFPNNFDFIRFVLAASVILCHSYVMYYGTANFLTKEPFLVWSHGQVSIGSMAVDFFFIISGFLIVKSFESSDSTINYLTKRVLRIYPGFITAFTLSILIAGFIGTGLSFKMNSFISLRFKTLTSIRFLKHRRRKDSIFLYGLYSLNLRATF
jgi:peptidoglycan/LPS O-acetylase OafA/YrhL